MCSRPRCGELPGNVVWSRDSHLTQCIHVHSRSSLYSGMPSQLAAPSFTQFAYPAYWSANFTGCTWVQKPCLDPLPATQQCLFFLVRARAGRTRSGTLAIVLRAQHLTCPSVLQWDGGLPTPRNPAMPGLRPLPLPLRPG